jgi:uncharacterized protein (TIGR03435 family)
MKTVRFAAAFLLAFAVSTSLPVLLESELLAQTPASVKDATPAATAANEPLIVDVHPSPYRNNINSNTNISDQRFDMRDATLLNIISMAWGRRSDTVLGGPSWIDFYRFDLAAKIDSLKAPKTTPSSGSGPNPMAAMSENQEADPYKQIDPVLQKVLTERFHFTYHIENKPLPGYVVTQAKGGAKVTEAKDATAGMNCRGSQAKEAPGQFTITCTSVTMDRLTAMFGGVFPHLMVDQTGLKKSYDFTFTLNENDVRTQSDYARMIMDAFAKQLGLVITAGDVPQPAMVIDKIDRTPTPNDPELTKLIPPLPDLEFEVASFKLAEPGGQQRGIEPRGSQVVFTSWSLQDLLVQAWELPTGAMIDKVTSLPTQRYTILVKLPPDIDARAVWQDQAEVNRMLQKLLVDRFNIKYHWGEQTQDGWVLLADSPKMKIADPNTRTFCAYGPPEGEKDIRSGADAPYDNQSHCQNVTMDQFTDMVQILTKSEVKNHVVNKTGLAGSYTFTFYYTSTRKLRADSAAAVAKAKDAETDSSSEPVSGMSIQDAFRKELGLKLEKQPLTVPALVLDHYDPTPTEN